MLDLAYVLLVTFIILTTAAVQGVTCAFADYAGGGQSRQAADAGDHDHRRRGGVSSTLIRSRRISCAPRLAQYKAANPNLPVVLKADAAAQYQKVMEVLEVVKSLDITEIGLVTKRATP